MKENKEPEGDIDEEKDHETTPSGDKPEEEDEDTQIEKRLETLRKSMKDDYGIDLKLKRAPYSISQELWSTRTLYHSEEVKEDEEITQDPFYIGTPGYTEAKRIEFEFMELKKIQEKQKETNPKKIHTNTYDEPHDDILNELAQSKHNGAHMKINKRGYITLAFRGKKWARRLTGKQIAQVYQHEENLKVSQKMFKKQMRNRYKRRLTEYEEARKKFWNQDSSKEKVRTRTENVWINSEESYNAMRKDSKLRRRKRKPQQQQTQPPSHDQYVREGKNGILHVDINGWQKQKESSSKNVTRISRKRGKWKLKKQQNHQ